MHKIRLYVVPEQEEEFAEENDEDLEDLKDLDIAPTLLQRKNSRRPGAIRVNVTPKKSKSHIINNNDEKKSSIINQKINTKNENFQQKKLNSTIIPPPKVPFRNSSLSNGRVLASPRIKQIAHDLQEKMLQHSGYNKSHINTDYSIYSSVSIQRKKLILKNSRIECNSFGEKIIINTGNKRSATTREYSMRKNCFQKDQHKIGSLPKIVKVKDEVDETENTQANQNANDANLAMLRRNNKLNGYRVRFFFFFFFTWLVFVHILYHVVVTVIFITFFTLLFIEFLRIYIYLIYVHKVDTGVSINSMPLPIQYHGSIPVSFLSHLV